jgi:hypothetical protein
MRARIENLDDDHDVYVYEESLDDLEHVRKYCQHMRDTYQWGPPHMRNYGVIPNIFVQMYMNVNNVSYGDFSRNPEHSKRLLNDPALRDFRIYPGRV